LPLDLKPGTGRGHHLILAGSRTLITMAQTGDLASYPNGLIATGGFRPIGESHLLRERVGRTATPGGRRRLSGSGDTMNEQLGQADDLALGDVRSEASLEQQVALGGRQRGVAHIGAHTSLSSSCSRAKKPATLHGELDVFEARRR
jgi:hypothetical protein